MSRCTRKDDLVVSCHAKSGNDVTKLANAHVLCAKCLAEAVEFGAPHPDSPDAPEFSEFVKNMALQRAKNQCECVRLSGCH